MLRFVLSLFCALVVLPGYAELVYLTTNPSAISTVDPVKAVEARVALPAARLGATKPAGWSLEWPSGAVSIMFNNVGFIDGVDCPKVTVTCAGQSVEIEDWFDYSGGFNTLAVEWAPDGSATVLGGADKLRVLLQVDGLVKPTDSLGVTASGSYDILDLIVETEPDNFERLHTAGLPPCQLENVAHWVYLDRDNDPAVARSGGAYELAAVPTDSGFDLIYVSGAVTNASFWQPGMLKGRLLSTGFRDYYKLEWFDASARRIAEECYAQTEGGKILKLVFPALRASLRFSLKP